MVLLPRHFTMGGTTNDIHAIMFDSPEWISIDCIIRSEINT